ncbi:MAG: putative Ig domain-containing protein, partial [Lysobacteraceae bacterium]
TYDSNNRVLRVVQDEVDNLGVPVKRIFDLAYDYDANGNRRRVVTQSGYGPNVTGIAVPNNAPPAVISTPADRTFRSGTSGAFRLLFSDVFRDAENDALTLTITQGNNAALPGWLVATRDPQTGEIVFTGTVPAGMADTDVVVKLTASETANAGNTISTTFTVRVRSNTTPVASTASTTFNAVVGKAFGRDLSAGVYFIDPDVGDTLSLSVVGTVPSWLTVNTSQPGVASLTGTPPSAGSYTLTLRATDAQGATFDRTITVNAAANAAPTVVAAPAMAIAKIGRPFAWSKPLSQVFADANSDTLQVSAVGMPPWLVFQSLGGATPELRFNAQVPLSEVDNAIYTITLTATDPSGASISTTLQVKVVVNVAPVAPASITLPVIKQNLAYSAVVPAFTDANGDTLTYNISTMPPGLVFDGETRTISGTPTTAGSWTIWYWANDGIAWTSTSFTMVVEANTAPVAPTVGNQNVTPGTTVNLTLPAFTDANGDALSYSASNLPTGLSFNPTTRAITGTASTAGSWAVTYTANDGRGGVTSTTFVFTVATAGANQAPVVAYALADQTAIGGEAFSYTVPANTFVDPEGQTLTYTAAKSDGTALPSWLSFNAGTRTFSGTPPTLGSLSWTLRVRATDPQGLYVDATFVLTKEAGGSQLMAPPETFEMGAMSQTSLLAGGGMMTTASLVSVQTRDQWFTYDGENRLKVVNGALVNGVIEVVASTATTNADSYSVQYDGAGHATAHVLRKTENSVTQTLVTLSTYDLRGNRRYEFHTQVLGGGFAGIAKEFIVDAAGQTLGTRSYFANGTIKQTLVPQGGQEPEVPEDVDVSGWLSDAETMQYDGDGRALMQAVYKRGLQGRENIQAEGNQYADISLLRLQNRVDYTHGDGGNAWTDTDLSNNASGYDAAGRLTTYRYSARNPDGPDWYTHTFTSAYEGWESWQEKTVAGASTNTANFKATTNTLHLDAYGRILKQQEHTEGASLDDRVRVYTYSGDGMVQTRREGTVNGSNVFTQSTKAPNDTPLNYQFVYAAGQQLAELQAGGEVRTALPTGGSQASQAFAAAIQRSGWTPTQTNTLSKIVGGSGPYTAGGGMATVLEGETLQSLAQRVYGTSTLWYVLADANGLSDATAPLTAGVQLKTPSVGVNSNDANTFKPYNPNEAIGSTAPGLPFIPPPQSNSCNVVAMILIVVIVVAVSVATWGVMTGPAATAGLAAAGITGTGAAIVAGAVAGAAGALAGQVAGSALGVSSFSWRNVAAGAITGALTAGIASQWGTVGQAVEGGAQATTTTAATSSGSVFGNLSRAAALAAGNGLAGYAGQKIAGLKPSFSWKSIAAGAVANVATASIAPGLSKGMGEFGQDVTAGLVGGVSGYAARKAFGFDDKFDFASVAADAIGSALGSAAGRGVNAAREVSAAARRDRNLKTGIADKSDLRKFGIEMGGLSSDYSYSETVGSNEADSLANIAADRAPDNRIRSEGQSSQPPRGYIRVRVGEGQFVDVERKSLIVGLNAQLDGAAQFGGKTSDRTLAREGANYASALGLVDSAGLQDISQPIRVVGVASEEERAYRSAMVHLDNRRGLGVLRRDLVVRYEQAGGIVQRNYMPPRVTGYPGGLSAAEHHGSVNRHFVGRAVAMGDVGMTLMAPTARQALRDGTMPSYIELHTGSIKYIYNTGADLWNLSTNSPISAGGIARTLGFDPTLS